MKGIRAGWLFFISVILAMTITYTYGKSITLLYGAIELAIAAVCYIVIFYNLHRLDNISSRLILIICCMSLINGAISGDLKSVLLISVSLVMILSVSVISMRVNDGGLDFMWAYFGGVALSLLAKVFDVFYDFNPNTLGFLYFTVLMLGFIWVRATRHKILAVASLAPCVLLALFSGSRNVAVMLIFALILLFLPRMFYASRGAYRALYALVLIYTVFAPAIILGAFQNEGFYSVIEGYTSTFSSKAWSLITRAEFFYIIEAKISALSPYHLMFGLGILAGHSHNLFYQAVLTYGLVGAIFLYLLLIRIFEMAGRLIREKRDNIVLGLAISLMCILMLNGADVFLFGSETYSVISQAIMGMILYRYRTAFASQALPEIPVSDNESRTLVGIDE